MALLEWFHQEVPGQGKRVQFPRGPAAVNGDETRSRHCLSAGCVYGAYRRSVCRYDTKDATDAERKDGKVRGVGSAVMNRDIADAGVNDVGRFW
jgi:hypothetical protein